jgi:glycosyltransferase involved in cell wall biosynthesis
MIRVLHIVASMNMGGLETFIMNIYRNINRTDIQFDFLELSENTCYYDQEIHKLGGMIFKVPAKSKNLIKSLTKIKKIVQDNNYHVIHRHYSSASMVLEIVAAKVGGATQLISHAHSTNSNTPKLIHYLARPLLNKISTVRLACSKDAGRWMYGKMAFSVINNGINVDEFIFNENVRNNVRSELGLTDKKIVGHVGRFNKVKNHAFIIHLFAQLQTIREDTVLVLVGDGPLREQTEILAKKLNVYDKIVFLGVRNDVNRLLQAFDVFVLPSLYEGFPMTLVEAQATGLCCLISNRVTKAASFFENNRYLGIEIDNIPNWATEIDTVLGNENDRNNAYITIKNSGYDIASTSAELMKLYGI